MVSNYSGLPGPLLKKEFTDGNNSNFETST